MGYWLIVYQIEGHMDVKNTVTTEHPFDFIVRMNRDDNEYKGGNKDDNGEKVMVYLVNFWSLTEEQYRNLRVVF